MQAKPATDEYAVMIDARDALEITPGGAGSGVGRLRGQLERRRNEARTLRNGARDGQLVVVSRDLTRALPVPRHRADAAGRARRLGALLDRCCARLRSRLETGARRGGVHSESMRALAPLPRAYHWVDGRAYVNHVELVRKARGAEMPASFWTDPLVYQGGSDDLLGADDDVPVVERRVRHRPRSRSRGDHRRRSDGHQRRTRRATHIKLLMLVNDWSLRNLIPAELAKGFGFYQSKPATAFSPVAVTPDELGDAWHDGKVHLPLTVADQRRAVRQAGRGRRHDVRFPAAHRARHEDAQARAGTIVGSGTISNYDRSRGSRVPRRAAHAGADRAGQAASRRS